MSEQDRKELEELLKTGVNGVKLIDSSFSETLEIEFKNGKKFQLSAFSENSDYKGYIETLQIK